MKNLYTKVGGVATMLLLLTTSMNAGAKGKGIEIAITEVKEIPVISPVPFYIGAGPLWGRYGGCDGKCKYVDVTYGILLKAGYKWHKNLAIEGRILATLFAEDPLGGETFRHFGLFVKPSMSLYKMMNAYGLVGLALTKTVTGGNHSLEKVNKSGFSFGIGVEYDISKHIKKSSFFLEYQRLLIVSDIPSMDTMGIGINYHF